MNTQDVVITVDEKHVDRIKQVAEELSRVGFKLKEVHENSGIITGSVDTSNRPRLASITGVLAVEDDQTVQI